MIKDKYLKRLRGQEDAGAAVAEMAKARGANFETIKKSLDMLEVLNLLDELDSFEESPTEHGKLIRTCPVCEDSLKTLVVDIDKNRIGCKNKKCTVKSGSQIDAVGIFNGGAKKCPINESGAFLQLAMYTEGSTEVETLIQTQRAKPEDPPFVEPESEGLAGELYENGRRLYNEPLSVAAAIDASDKVARIGQKKKREVKDAVASMETLPEFFEYLINDLEDALSLGKKISSQGIDQETLEHGNQVIGKKLLWCINNSRVFSGVVKRHNASEKQRELDRTMYTDPEECGGD